MDEARKPFFLKLILGLLIIAALVAATFIISREAQKLTFKLKYPELITKYSHEYGLDPYLVAAVIHAESGNRAEVVSPVGAVGLMQVMPPTGEWIAEKLDVDLNGGTQKALKTPETNVRFGCWYLSHLSERFNSVELVLCAYNAGPSRVGKWLEDSQLSEDGKLLRIPFPETEKYVERVLRARKKYMELYPEKLIDKR